MKRTRLNFWLALVLCLSILPLANCNDDRDYGEEIKLREIRDPNPGKEPRVELGPKFAPGKYRFVSNVEVKMDVDADDEQLKITTDAMTEWFVTVSPTDDPKRHKLELRFGDMSLSVKNPHGTSRLDTKKGDVSPEFRSLADLKGKSVTIVVDEKGNIVQRKSLDQLVAQTWDPAAKTVVESTFSRDTQAIMGSSMTPDKPVGVSAIWTTELPHMTMKKLMVPWEMELVKFETVSGDKVARIKGYAPLKFPPNTKVPDTPGTIKGGAVRIEADGIYDVKDGYFRQLSQKGLSTMDIQQGGDVGRVDVGFSVDLKVTRP
jgi:hypothetical protein